MVSEFPSHAQIKIVTAELNCMLVLHPTQMTAMTAVVVVMMLQ